VEGAPEIPATIEKAYTDLIRSLIEAYRLADEPFTIEPTFRSLGRDERALQRNREAPTR
jgi:hypothetical protein